MPDRISSELGLDETESRERCEEILQLLKEKSPRVYERIMANRIAMLPSVSLDRLIEEDEGERPRFEPASAEPNPEESLVDKEIQQIVWDAIKEVWGTLSKDEKRLLVLLYDKEMTPSDIAKSALSLLLPGITEAHQVYYRKDTTLRKLSEGVEKRWRSLDPKSGELKASRTSRKVLDALEEILRGRGVLGLGQ